MIALAMASGCSAADDDTLPSNQSGEPQRAAAPSSVLEDEDSMNLLAEVALEGRVIKFFEPEEGTILEVEKAVDGLKADPKEAGLSGSALYTYLTKTEAPAALLDAEWRVRDLAARNGNSIVEERDDGSVSVSDPATTEKAESGHAPGLRTTAEWDEGFLVPVFADDAYFTNKYCRQTDRFWSCGAPGFRCVGNSHIETTGTNMMQSGARANEGGHRYHLSYSTDGWATLNLTQGELAGWRRTSGINATARSDVDHGGTGWYRHCVNYHY